MFGVTKTYTHETGLSCCFRQWRAIHSHCRFLHGYALAVRVELCDVGLDNRNWVFDFGDFKWLKEFLHDTFDHKTVIAADDPDLPRFQELHEKEVIDLMVVPHVGCEQFAKIIYQRIYEHFEENGIRVDKLKRVTVSEHGGNEAWCGR